MALGLGRCVVTALRRVLLHLPKNPRVSGGGPADHDGVAARFADHAFGIFGGVDVAVTDDGNLHRLFHSGDDAPVGGAGVTLQSRARMDSNTFDSHVFGHHSDLDRNDGLVVPSSAQLDRKWDANGSTNGSENLSEQWKIAQQAGTAALDDFFGGAAEIDVHGVVAEIFDHFGGFRHDLGIRTEELRGDGMLIFLKIKIAKRLGGAPSDALGAGELRHEQTAAAESANDAAEKRVGDASHRGKNRGGADGQVANLERSWKHMFSTGGGARVQSQRSRRGRWNR